MLRLNSSINKIGWLLASAFCNKVVQLTTSIILINLLTPEIFGLTTISLSIFFLTQGILNLGFESALIHDNININNSKIFSAWTMEVVKGFILCIFLFLLSHQISLLLGNLEIEILLKLTSLIFLIDGLKNINIVFLKKNMEFKKIFFLEFFPFLISNVITLILAITYKEAWIIIFGLIMNRLLYTILSYIITDSKIKFKFDIFQVKELFSYGRWIITSSIFSILRVQGINVFLAKFVGFESLGIYNRSVNFSEDLFNQVNNLYWKFGFPYLSKHNLDKNNLFFVFIKTFEVMFCISLILFFTIILISDTFISTFFDVNIWGEMIVLMKLISVYSLIVLAQSPFGILYQAIGLPKLGTKTNILFFIILLLITYPLFLLFQINGVVYALILSSALTFIFNNYLIYKYIGLELYRIYFPLKNKFLQLTFIFILFILMNIIIESFFLNLLFPVFSFLTIFKGQLLSFLTNDQ